MDQVLELAGVVLRVILAGIFALAPGMAVWVSAAVLFVAIRRLRQIGRPPKTLLDEGTLRS